MNLSDLCGICIPKKYDPTQYNAWGEKIIPELCPDDKVIIDNSVISDVLVQQIIPHDNMLETNESVFTTKNKLYCGEQ